MFPNFQKPEFRYYIVSASDDDLMPIYADIVQGGDSSNDSENANADAITQPEEAVELRDTRVEAPMNPTVSSTTSDLMKGASHLPSKPPSTESTAPPTPPDLHLIGGSAPTSESITTNTATLSCQKIHPSGRYCIASIFDEAKPNTKGVELTPTGMSDYIQSNERFHEAVFEQVKNMESDNAQDGSRESPAASGDISTESSISESQAVNVNTPEPSQSNPAPAPTEATVNPNPSSCTPTTLPTHGPRRLAMSNLATSNTTRNVQIKSIRRTSSSSSGPPNPISRTSLAETSYLSKLEGSREGADKKNAQANAYLRFSEVLRSHTWDPILEVWKPLFRSLSDSSSSASSSSDNTDSCWYQSDSVVPTDTKVPRSMFHDLFIQCWDAFKVKLVSGSSANSVSAAVNNSDNFNTTVTNPSSTGANTENTPSAPSTSATNTDNITPTPLSSQLSRTIFKNPKPNNPPPLPSHSEFATIGSGRPPSQKTIEFLGSIGQGRPGGSVSAPTERRNWNRVNIQPVDRNGELTQLFSAVSVEDLAEVASGVREGEVGTSAEESEKVGCDKLEVKLGSAAVGWDDRTWGRVNKKVSPQSRKRPPTASIDVPDFLKTSPIIPFSLPVSSEPIHIPQSTEFDPFSSGHLFQLSPNLPAIRPVPFLESAPVSPLSLEHPVSDEQSGLDSLGSIPPISLGRGVGNTANFPSGAEGLFTSSQGPSLGTGLRPPRQEITVFNVHHIQQNNPWGSHQQAYGYEMPGGFPESGGEGEFPSGNRARNNSSDSMTVEVCEIAVRRRHPEREGNGVEENGEVEGGEQNEQNEQEKEEDGDDPLRGRTRTRSFRHRPQRDSLTLTRRKLGSDKRDHDRDGSGDRGKRSHAPSPSSRLSAEFDSEHHLPSQERGPYSPHHRTVVPARNAFWLGIFPTSPPTLDVEELRMAIAQQSERERRIAEQNEARMAKINQAVESGQGVLGADAFAAFMWGPNLGESSRAAQAQDQDVSSREESPALSGFGPNSQASSLGTSPSESVLESSSSVNHTRTHPSHPFSPSPLVDPHNPTGPRDWTPFKHNSESLAQAQQMASYQPPIVEQSSTRGLMNGFRDLGRAVGSVIRRSARDSEEEDGQLPGLPFSVKEI